MIPVEYDPTVRQKTKRGVAFLTLLACLFVRDVFGQPVPAERPPAESTDALHRLLPSSQLCVGVGSKFANRFVRTSTRDEGPVRDFVMGAHVTGVQQTEARTRLDFVPNAGNARLMLVLEGTTNNQTSSFTPQAIVHSEGSYRFQLAKQIDFDGHVFKTRSPAACMTIDQRHRGAQTPMSPMPLLGPLSSMAALYAAEQRRPVSERIAAMRLTEQIGPKFNHEVDQQLAAMNQWLATQARPRLTEWQAMPTRVATATTADLLLLAASLEDLVDPLPLPPRTPLATDGVSLMLHESALGSLLSKTPLAGLELPDTALQRLFRPGTAPAGEPAVPQLATVILDRERPLSLAFAEGELRIEIRAGFRPVLGPAVPTQVIRISLHPTLNDDHLTVGMRLDDVRPLEPSGESTVSTVAQTILRQQIEQQLQDLRLPTTFEIPDGKSATKIPLRLETLTLAGGWLTIVFVSGASEWRSPIPELEFQPPILEGPRLR